jgi:hypothetical protein
VLAEAGVNPLSVSADRIAHAAFRCAGLLARLAALGEPVDRAGSGVVVEVYPAAALRRLGLTHRGYKSRDHFRQPTCRRRSVTPRRPGRASPDTVPDSVW